MQSYEVIILSLQRINQRRRFVNFNDTINMRKYVDGDSCWKKESRITYMSGVSSRILDIIIQGYWLMGNGWSLMIVECMILGMFGRTGSMRICCFIRGLRMINIIIFN